MHAESCLWRILATGRFAELSDRRESPRDCFPALIHGAKCLSKLHVASICLRRLPFELSPIVLRRGRSCWMIETAKCRNSMRLRLAKKALIDAAAAGHTSHVPNPTMTVRRATRLLAVRSVFRARRCQLRHFIGNRGGSSGFHASSRTFGREFVLRRTLSPLRSSQSPQRGEDG